jgi:molybdenum cofactor biosynthesis enzyme MoaA
MELRYVLTNKCNFDCYFCLKEYDIEKANYILNSNDFFLISKIAFEKLDIKEVTLTGGEPLLYSQFETLVNLLHKLNIKITIVTNGYYLNKYIHTFHLIDEMHISLHSFNNTDWQRITNTNSNSLQRVMQNIIDVRTVYPSLRMKLNVVSEKGNNQTENIKKYLEFADRYNLEITVFKESYTTWAKKMNIPTKFSNEPEEFWNIQPFNPQFINENNRKKNYRIENVKLSLSHTSADFKDTSSIWVNQYGFIYSDIYRINYTNSLYDSLINKNENEICRILKSMMQ